MLGFWAASSSTCRRSGHRDLRPTLLLGTAESEVFTTVDEVRAAFERDSDNMAGMRWGEPRNIDVVETPQLSSVIVELPISYGTGRRRGPTVRPATVPGACVARFIGLLGIAIVVVAIFFGFCCLGSSPQNVRRRA